MSLFSLCLLTDHTTSMSCRYLHSVFPNSQEFISNPIPFSRWQCYPGGVTNLMLAAQAHIPNKSGALPSTFFADLPATSNSCNTSPNSSSSSGNYMISQTVSIPSPNSNLSPTSVSSSASCFIYPPLIGRCHLVSDKIIDIETSVLAFSQVRLVRLQH